ncbi:MotA/TolQ/ExbB proton channel family protein [Cetobacterium sp.]|uniref:MotA/TolQ/ExbB proton channel family protein n=1 Tax=Cetobacterium sp. TaxID=2071632 RepID=UPI003F3A3E1D
MNIIDSTSFLNNIFCLGIIGYAIKAFFELLPTKKLSKELKEYLVILKLIKDKKNEFQDIKSDEIYQEYKMILSTKNFKHINNNIEDYNNSLFSKSFQNVKSEDFFNEISLIESNFNIHSLTQKGPTLVGLGVLGTFAGLFLSLNEIGIGSGTTQQISIIDEIIPGMSLAFLTSLLGMFCSIIYTRCQKTWIGESVREIGQIEYHLGVIFPRDNTSDIVLKIEENLKQLSESLTKDLGNSVAVALDQNKNALFGTFEKSMDKNMNKMTTDISSVVSKGIGQIFNQELVDSFKEIKNTLIETKDSIENNNTIFIDIVKDLPKIVTRFKTMNDISNSIFQNAQNSMQEYDKYMKGTGDFLISMEKMSLLQTQIENSVHNLNSIVVKSYSDLEESTNKNSETINNTVQNLAGHYKGINSDFKEGLLEMLNKNEVLLNSMNNSIEKNAQNILELDKTMESSVKLITNGMEDRRKDFEAQHIKIKENQENLENEIGKALNEYDSTVSNVTGQIKDIILNLKDMIVSKND